MKTEKELSFPLMILTVVFCTSLIVSNIIAGKLWSAPLGIVLTAGVLDFPIVYILGDVLPEVYGLKVARRVIWLGFVANLYAVVFFGLTLLLPFPPFWENQGAFQVVLGFTPRLLVASFCGYLVGTNVNAWIMVKVRELTQGRLLWVRTISSTIFGEGSDSIVFMTIAFLGIVPTSELPTMILAQALFKTTYEAVATPLTYAVVNYVKRLEGVTDPMGTAAMSR